MIRPLTRILFCAALAAALVPAQTANPKQPQPKSQKELEAIQAIFQAPDPDARIAAAKELVTKFADTEFKATAFYVGAFSYQQKGDLENAIVWAEQAVEADPKFYGAMLMIANALALRTQEFDLDREEKLGRAEKLAKQAMELINSAPKPRPDITDEQWEGAKKDFLAQAHEALGLAALARKNYAACASELGTAASLASQQDPSLMVRLANCQIHSGKIDEALALLDKVLNDPNAVPQVKNVAAQLKVDANKKKAEAAK
ncbi:MAG: tetratricopeptide repeat protein [Bryobacteraceae bacterium]|nr:tetratricopeptide repeat protein [Bryobacteraceae bacterium]